MSAFTRHTVEDVWPVFEGAFKEYGLPNKIRSDNGPPFGCCGVGRLTRLSVKFIKAGVIPEWIQPGHPEQNGRHERFHLTLKQEVASPPKATLNLQIQAMNQFHSNYNFVRPHEALNMQTPGSIYQHSPRKWNGLLKEPEYDIVYDVRKVEKVGCITWKGYRIFIGESLGGEHVGIRRDTLECYYGSVYLGKINPEKGLEKPKMQTRRQR